MKAALSLREVLSVLAGEGLVRPFEDEEFIVEPVSPDSRRSALPWYVKLFIGISAWISAILITAFFFIVGIIDERQAHFWGVTFCAVAIFMNRLSRGNTFWVQLSLAMCLTGQVLVIFGLFSLFNDSLPILIFVTLLEVALIWLHRDSILRFISTLVIVIFLLVHILDRNALNSLHLLIFVLAAGTLVIYLMENRLKLHSLGEAISPVGYGITVSFLGILVMPLLEQFDLQWQITAITLFVLLLFLLSQIVQDLGYGLQNRVVIALAAGCFLLLVPSLRMPGILAALMVLVLGFWRSNRGLMGLASIFLVFYIWAYYYSLEWTLLVKSLVLLGSGGILLAVRFFILRFISDAGDGA